MTKIITIYIRDKGGTISARDADIVIKTHEYCKEVFPNASITLLEWMFRRAIEIWRE